MSLETISKIEHHHHKLHQNTHYGKTYFAVLLAGFSSLAGWFLGYDQGVTGGVVVMSSFKNDFCVGVYPNASVCDLPVSGLPPDYRRFLVLFTWLKKSNDSHIDWTDCRMHECWLFFICLSTVCITNSSNKSTYCECRQFLF